MYDRIRHLLGHLGERLWVRPLALCVLSILAALLARAADGSGLKRWAPGITLDSIEQLLTTLSGSMLVIATFAVASMVAAYASASTTATPRSFSLVIADDVSQNALSTFIGAFIFSVVALIALKNGYYATAGRFVLFCLTLAIFATVIVTFVYWVDRIARLGRLGATVAKVETATAAAMRRRRAAPALGGVPARSPASGDVAVHAERAGYVQTVDVPALQHLAERHGMRIRVAAVPGTFAAPDRALAYACAEPGGPPPHDTGGIADAFAIGDDRRFTDDPRFGLVVLSEIASRALSPAVNDAGTAIDVIGRLLRLLLLWRAPRDAAKAPPACDRVEVPTLALDDLFDDAFTAIARDGAGAIEVAGRLQKALASLAATGDGAMRAAAVRHARLARARAEQALTLEQDRATLRELAAFAEGDARARPPRRRDDTP